MGLSESNNRAVVAVVASLTFAVWANLKNQQQRRPFLELLGLATWKPHKC